MSFMDIIRPAYWAIVQVVEGRDGSIRTSINEERLQGLPKAQKNQVIAFIDEMKAMLQKRGL